VAALIARHREPALLRVNITAAVVNVSLNLALIPVFGLAGAAWATVVSEVVRLGVALVAAREAIPGTLPAPALLKVLVAGAGMGLAVVVSGTAQSLVALVVGGVVYPLLLVLVGVVAVGGPDRVRVRA
jgi:O-antigen/teichoic acid export membrane protein